MRRINIETLFYGYLECVFPPDFYGHSSLVLNSVTIRENFEHVGKAFVKVQVQGVLKQLTWYVAINSANDNQLMTYLSLYTEFRSVKIDQLSLIKVSIVNARGVLLNIGETDIKVVIEYGRAIEAA